MEIGKKISQDAIRAQEGPDRLQQEGKAGVCGGVNRDKCSIFPTQAESGAAAEEKSGCNLRHLPCVKSKRSQRDSGCA